MMIRASEPPMKERRSFSRKRDIFPLPQKTYSDTVRCRDAPVNTSGININSWGIKMSEPILTSELIRAAEGPSSLGPAPLSGSFLRFTADREASQIPGRNLRRP